MLENAPKEYFINNDNDSVTPETPLAAHKSVMRGTLIWITSKLKRERRAQIQKRTEEFLSLNDTNATPRLTLQPSSIQPE